MNNSGSSVTFELVITSKNPSSVSLELVKEVLISQGVELDEIVETDERPFHYLSIFFASSFKARLLREKLKKLKIKPLALKIKKLFKDDWFNKWKSEFKTFDLTPCIRIVPAWDKKEQRRPQSKVMIVIDTGFAFGSGLHPATRFMARLIERNRGKFNTFLDVGTGSGILTLTALVSGAKEIRAVDISQDAVHAANANFKRNGFTGIKASKVDINDYNARGTFDFVAANLITHDLIQLKSKLFKLVKKGKLLAISGISINNFPLLKRAFAPLPLKCLKIERGEGWSALLYKRL